MPPTARGWRVGIGLAILAAVSTLIINIMFIILGTQLYQQDSDDGMVTLIHGNCQKVDRLKTWLHLIINILGAILLSASNYTQQCISAPTRGEVDSCHRKKDWMEIGVPSLRNLTRIPRKRAALWAILGLSSVPLHLLCDQPSRYKDELREFPLIGMVST